MFQFKVGRKSTETARDNTDAFDPGYTNEREAYWWYKKFRRC